MPEMVHLSIKVLGTGALLIQDTSTLRQYLKKVSALWASSHTLHTKTVHITIHSSL